MEKQESDKTEDASAVKGIVSGKAAEVAKEIAEYKIISSASVKTFERLISEYGREVAKEQREICAKIKPSVPFRKINEWAFREHIQDAPEPPL